MLITEAIDLCNRASRFWGLVTADPQTNDFVHQRMLAVALSLRPTLMAIDAIDGPGTPVDETLLPILNQIRSMVLPLEG